MPIIKTFDFYDFKREFEIYKRQDQFSEQGLKIIFDYLSECYVKDNLEMDVIAFCTEFSESPCSELLQDNDIVYSDDMSDDEVTEQVREYLHDNTSLVGEYVNNDGENVFVYVAF